ncbi:hypothetical protein METBIDRAFT_226571 [Metschnikowia bicuspidata var. bicuspidata NRRL YB-4993]|uniref:Uncharacterized protein n=1 Tax=Metschnikowia bicuspidata var. bicuspidata NRRL YB-4993 TaxID=869754 RepID=A0A1A0H1U1_9ASCO|nr:hypothetical protein METBIDRAFT_226571 [Metschnikowia bicuspidata var. bicuspidata NRRL YB-4993]OBA17996.1 hypothetical protein METBIDRAFT_226571 [Metschnikowia bicuspidata var. bicuspidata NRRL YB-4993]
MADSTASIKSIYSGKGGLSDEDFEDLSGVSLVPFSLSEKQISNNFQQAVREASTDFKKSQDNFAALNADQTSNPDITEPRSHHLTEVSARNFGRHLDLEAIDGSDFKAWNVSPPEWYVNHVTSTNVSLASLFSGQQLGTRSPSRAEYSEADYSPSESHSRPLSRNSNNSAFSTIATKDGIEGKRPYKMGLKPLLETVLANKNQQLLSNVQNQQSQQTQQDSSNYHNASNSEKSPPLRKATGADSVLESEESNLRTHLDGVEYLPITIDEKIELMNRDSMPRK